MLFLSAVAFITLLMSFSPAMHAQNIPNHYIIKERGDLSKPYLEVFGANGKLAYTFSKSKRVPPRGKTTVIITDSSLKQLFSMFSGPRWSNGGRPLLPGSPAG
ncbi:uncharacterized protein PGTG_05791 [Puccinia graminis f. sp. tritici CRL 75-36-700-3]|uniref:Uncharacterized protein n=1 Tax=Puccinia graminis f. sp. tritici (strain CRL 75-36-700-3 / race SCCL) TaxID=418459 RepID=E3K5L3_PUCGT|nr:uncharacterized protein PGTG_05791 [Puccinia graminis f. sp. tritici CRL 75-36-700-3]EFP79470.1 hypothetical protein PGTG_05791 [Puccinia graminis f. sp. tritici CRL 75-36-700-3]